MKIVMIIFFIISTTCLFAQTYTVNGKMPHTALHLTTINDNTLKGLLLEVKDTSVLIYPGKFKEWKKGTKYKQVEFGYVNIRELALKRKNNAWKRYYINGSGPLFNELKK